jgi:hypothetical protein
MRVGWSLLWLWQGPAWDLCASDFILKSTLALQYFPITSCSSATVVADFLASLEEQGPERKPFDCGKDDWFIYYLWGAGP